MNAFLKKRAMKIEELTEDLQTGIPLIVLLEIISGNLRLNVPNENYRRIDPFVV